jgi:holo-[acyl-carrier protein] synthase
MSDFLTNELLFKFTWAFLAGTSYLGKMKIGVDIVDVEEVADIINSSRGAFLRRAFSMAEIRHCESKLAGKYQSYAGKLAAKEAFMKAMGTGWRKELQWKYIEVQNDECGAPFIILCERIQRKLAEKGEGKIALSISHTKDQAIAFVIIA